MKNIKKDKKFCKKLLILSSIIFVIFGAILTYTIVYGEDNKNYTASLHVTEKEKRAKLISEKQEKVGKYLETDDPQYLDNYTDLLLFMGINFLTEYELRQVAKEHNIEHYDSLKESDLIEAISLLNLKKY